MGLPERSRLPFAALIALGVGSLLFDLTLSWRLPSDADWAEVAAALRSAAQPGDGVQIWPVWAERARMFVDAAPVLAEEDLERADYAGVRRLWLLSLPRTPFFRSADGRLVARGATPATDARRFGALSLRAWDLHHCFDPRCAMHPGWSPGFTAYPEVALCLFDREKSERKIKLGST